MSDKQLDMLEQTLVGLGEYGRFKWLPGVRTLLADYRRLRELERAVRDAMHPLPMGRGWVWRGDATDIDTIGRLLEGEGE